MTVVCNICHINGDVNDNVRLNLIVFYIIQKELRSNAGKGIWISGKGIGIIINSKVKHIRIVKGPRWQPKKCDHKELRGLDKAL